MNESSLSSKDECHTFGTRTGSSSPTAAYASRTALSHPGVTSSTVDGIGMSRSSCSAGPSEAIAGVPSWRLRA